MTGIRAVNVRSIRSYVISGDILGVELLQDYLTAHSLASSEVLCLGLGSPSFSANSRAQLGFLLELCEAMGIVGSYTPHGR